MTFSVTRIRNGNAYLLHVGTHGPDSRADLVVADEHDVIGWFDLWLAAPEHCQKDMQKMIEEMTPEERLGRGDKEER